MEMHRSTSFVLTLICILKLVAIGTKANLDDQLRKYEILHLSDLHPHRVRRSVGSTGETSREYNFRAFGREFHLYLQRRLHISTLMPGFDVQTVDEEGKKNTIPIDLSDFYVGNLVDDRHSVIHARLEGKQLSASIESRNETFVIEPAEGLVPNVSDDSVIIYRESDLKQTKNFCGSVRVNDSYPMLNDNSTLANKFSDNSRSSETLRRSRRSAKKLDTCPLLLVADYRFYDKIGKKNIQRTSRILIELIDRINRIYRRTKFTDSKKRILEDYGFAIKRILIHQSWTKGSPSHYNRAPASPTDTWHDRALLSAFDRADYSDYCLAHLFTYQRFPAGTLGLAYIASPMSGALGGVCSNKQPCDGMYCSINTGWTTYQDTSGNTLITLESHLVTAHELGHNMGSSHDPDNSECSPPSNQNGKYLMYQYSVSGYEINNRHFSPCSRRAIGRVLESKAAACFAARQKNFCGNSRLEEGEQCDGGDLGLQDKDPCCTTDCRFKAGAMCSPVNHQCCTLNCRISPRGEKCSGGDLTGVCETAQGCNGSSYECPDPIPNDGAACSMSGKCKNGKCVPYCEINNMISCQCDEIKKSCFMCCRKTANATCEQVIPAKRLKDGLPCVQGTCEAGVCKRINVPIERIWLIIKYSDVNEVGRLIWANIVGFVIAVSLIIWCPLSCIVSRIDRRDMRFSRRHREAPGRTVANPSA